MEELGTGTLVGGRYRVVRLLGRGGMGAVYHAVHEPLGRAVALKVLPQKFASDARFVARFKREAEIMAALQHPNIVQVSDFVFEPQGITHLVMELLHGESLEQRLQRGPLGADETQSIARQIADALAVAHAKGVIHRDLKPANVFLTPVAGVDMVKLLDFGIAKLLDDGLRLTSTGALIGTPKYMSPEQIRGREVSAATDVWALGVCVFEMLVGGPPFEGDSLAALVPQILGEPLSLPEEIGEPLRTLIDKALRMDPARRFRDAADVRGFLTSDPRALAATMRAPDARVSIPAPTPPPEFVGRSRRWPIVVIVAAAALALASVALWNGAERATPEPSTIGPSTPGPSTLGSSTPAASTPAASTLGASTPERPSAPVAASHRPVPSEPSAPSEPREPHEPSDPPSEAVPAMATHIVAADEREPVPMRVRAIRPEPAPMRATQPIMDEPSGAMAPSMVVDDPSNELIDVFPDE